MVLLTWLRWVLMQLFPQAFGTAAQRLADDDLQVLRVLGGLVDRRATLSRIGVRRWGDAIKRLHVRREIIFLDPLQDDGPDADGDVLLHLTRAGWERLGEPLSETDLAALRWVRELGPGAREFRGPVNDRMRILGLVADERGLTMAGHAVLEDGGAR
jgi:hypothetical protein